MKLIDLEHAFFKPVWIRVVVVAVCAGWAMFEFANDAVLCGVFFGGLAVICAYRFSVINYSAIADPAKEQPHDDDTP